MVLRLTIGVGMARPMKRPEEHRWAEVGGIRASVVQKDECLLMRRRLGVDN